MTDQDYMRRAITLAGQGAGWTSPNPMVGAVVVKDGHIIGEGAHLRCGQPHAERNAIAACTEDPAGATIYVTLEPCCHYGRTPPCTEILLEKKIARVVIGSRDPNPKVAGKGAALLRARGVRVEEDFLRGECDGLNQVFFHYITTGRPYVTLKYAMTLDGKIATRTGDSKWITGEEARKHVHSLRGRYAGILAGIGTVLADDPLLNCRLEGGHQPTRIICDSHLRIPPDSRICKTAGEYNTILACAAADPGKKAGLEALGAEVWQVPDENGQVDLRALMVRLGQAGIDSVLLEGGGAIHEAALRAGIVNHVCAYIAPKLFGGRDAKTPVEGLGVETPGAGAGLSGPKTTVLGSDILLEYDVTGGMNGVYWNC